MKWEKRQSGYYELYSESGLLLGDCFKDYSRYDYPWDWQVFVKGGSHHGRTKTLKDAKQSVEFEANRVTNG